ncbi:uncharacterized protein LOC143132186 [Alosa pseudoharengus]|uniref:uncharacterized protein LOC143132186 n=1 Tax=Alosa pseudoharengus TaxID=34774 RepID=UPI003F8ADE84
MHLDISPFLSLPDCSITAEGYAVLTSAVKSEHLHLTELDLRGNNPGHLGGKLIKSLCNFVKGSLRFLKGDAAEKACANLEKVLGTNPLFLTMLDFSKKKLGDSGLEHISALLKDSHCRVKTLKLNYCGLTKQDYSILAKILSSESSNLTHLDLSHNTLGDCGVKQLSEMMNPHCNLEILRLNNCGLTEQNCSVLATILSSESSNLTHLDLSHNNLLGDPGVKQLSDGLKSPHCKLEILRLSDCSITGDGYAALASALKSNPSHLVELDLKGNNPGESGVELLTDFYNLLNDSKFKLQTLRLLKSKDAEEVFAYLTSVGINPLLQTELDLDGKKQGGSRVKQLSALLEDSHCRLQKLTLNNCGLTEQNCSVLATILSSESSNLTHLDLSHNNLLGDPGVKQLSDGLKSPHCKLEILRLSDCSITGDGYAALASALKSNPSHLVELDLKGNNPGESGVELLTDFYNLLNDSKFKLQTLRLLKSKDAEEVFAYLTSVGINPLLQTELDLDGKKQGGSRVKQLSALLEDSHCRLQKLTLNNCGLTEQNCSVLATILSSESSNLTHLDLSHNNLLGDPGVKQLSDGLKSPHCKLEILRLSDCSITGDGYAALASALKSNPSHLVELDLKGNNPGESGVELLTDFYNLLNDSKFKLQTLRLLKSKDAEEVFAYLTSVGINPLLQTELDLDGKKQGGSRVKQLSALLEDSHCRLQKLTLNNSSITKEDFAALTSALRLNPSHLIELNLSGNKIGHSGAKHISDLLKNQHNKLQRLILSDCSITGDGYAALASALKSKNSQLTELDLRGNDPGESGVKLLTDLYNLLEGPNPKLKTLRLLKSDAAEKVFAHLTEVLGKNPLLQTELDLSGKIQGDSGVNQFSALLEDSHCKLQKLMFNDGKLTTKGCAALTSALRSNPSHLIELNWSGNKLGDSGAKNISDLLREQHCKLQILRLNNSSVTEEGCATLASALTSNPSHLIELNLSRNKVGDSGAKEISSFLLKNCKLQRLLLSHCSITEDGYAALASALKSKNSQLIELDLRGNDPGDSEVKLLTDLYNLLEGPNPKLKTLRFLESEDAEKACTYLTEVLGTNPLFLTKLDFSKKKLGDLGMKELSALLEDSHCKVKTLKLNNCDLTERNGSVLATILSSESSKVSHLDLSNNTLGDSGVKQLSDGLKSPHCKLEILRLSDCRITRDGYAALASALKSKNSQLIELDLRGNNPGGSGVELFTDFYDLLNDSKCKLQTLRLLKSKDAEEVFAYLTSVGINPLLQTELDLGGKKLGDSRVKQLSALLEDSHCRLQKLMLNYSNIGEEGCAHLTKALTSNPSHLIELDLSGNELGDSGVKHISALLKNPNCKLQKLLLNNTNIKEEGCAALASALTSNPSHLIELDLSMNKFGKSGVKHISALLKSPDCKLQKLLLNNTNIKEEGCAALASALTSNPLHLIELDLSMNTFGKSGVEHISALLKSPDCKLQKLLLNNTNIKEEGCAALASALTSNPLHLIELDLSMNTFGKSGVKHISALLKSPDCKLQKLLLNNTNIKEEGCAALASALKVNHSHLIELQLKGNKLGDSAKTFFALAKDPNYKLRTLGLDEILLKKLFGWIPIPKWGNDDASSAPSVTESSSEGKGSEAAGISEGTQKLEKEPEDDHKDIMPDTDQGTGV